LTFPFYAVVELNEGPPVTDIKTFIRTLAGLGAATNHFKSLVVEQLRQNGEDFDKWPAKQRARVLKSGHYRLDRWEAVIKKYI